MIDSQPVWLGVMALSWIAYFASHSALASSRAKTWCADHRPDWFRHYRPVYNALALVLLLPPMWLVATWPGALLWEWKGAAAWISHGLSIAAVAAFAHSSRYYDMAAFTGLGRRPNAAPEPLRLSPYHRYVRHPWYSFGLVLLWTRDMNAATLVSSVLISLYLVVGSRLEESRLLADYGDAYRRYRKRVPGLVPRPWKHLSKKEAETIVAQASRHSVLSPQEARNHS
jgi:protein-S-isoprenylcysteine O-methyltransferase Ste14